MVAGSVWKVLMNKKLARTHDNSDKGSSQKNENTNIWLGFKNSCYLPHRYSQ